jgi:uncharacterized membrane protein
MKRSPSDLLDSLRTGFWAVPTSCALLAAGLAVAMVEMDRTSGDRLGRLAFRAGPDGAREVLSAITTSMITFTGLVFSITIVVLQLTSSQFSPRVLRTFLRDRQTQWSLGAFVATFVNAVMVLRSVNSSDGQVFVPATATTVGVVLLLVSVGVFIAYIHHVSTAIQVSSLIHAVGEETRTAIARLLPTEDAPKRSRPALPGRSRVVLTRTYGVVTSVDVQELVGLARRADVVLVLRPALGEFVPEGAPLLDVHGDGPLADDAAVRAVVLGRNRTMQQDVAFGFRQLVDVAERALSPGVNDPTTAVQTLDELQDLLRRLVVSPLPDGIHVDTDGTVRLLTRALRLGDLLSLALDEIDQYGAEATQVQSRIASLLDDLEPAATPEHRSQVRAYARRRSAGRSVRTRGGALREPEVMAERRHARDRAGPLTGQAVPRPPDGGQHQDAVKQPLLPLRPPTRPSRNDPALAGCARRHRERAA